MRRVDNGDNTHCSAYATGRATRPPEIPVDSFKITIFRWPGQYELWRRCRKSLIASSHRCPDCSSPAGPVWPARRLMPGRPAGRLPERNAPPRSGIIIIRFVIVSRLQADCVSVWRPSIWTPDPGHTRQPEAGPVPSASRPTGPSAPVGISQALVSASAPPGRAQAGRQRALWSWLLDCDHKTDGPAGGNRSIELEHTKSISARPHANARRGESLIGRNRAVRRADATERRGDNGGQPCARLLAAHNYRPKEAGLERPPALLVRARPLLTQRPTWLADQSSEPPERRSANLLQID